MHFHAFIYFFIQSDILHGLQNIEAYSYLSKLLIVCGLKSYSKYMTDFSKFSQNTKLFFFLSSPDLCWRGLAVRASGQLDFLSGILIPKQETKKAPEDLNFIKVLRFLILEEQAIWYLSMHCVCSAFTIWIINHVNSGRNLGPDRREVNTLWVINSC